MSGHECRKFSNFNAFTALMNIVDGRAPPGGRGLGLGGKFHTYAFLFRTGRLHAHAAPPKGLLLVHVSPTRDTVSPFQEGGWLRRNHARTEFSIFQTRGPAQFFADEHCTDPCNSCISPAKAPLFPSSVLCRPLKAFMARFLDVLLFTNGSSRRINSERGRTFFTSFSCARGISLTRTLFLDERNFLLLD